MGLEDLLLQKKKVILKKWLDRILETYPADAKSFLKKENNRFANPEESEYYKGQEEIEEYPLEKGARFLLSRTLFDHSFLYGSGASF